MVRDGYYYGFVLLAAGVLVGWLAAPVWSTPALLLAAFFLWFFRDPNRAIPDDVGVLVSPADGKVTDISPANVDGIQRTRISIFLNVFNVHVNRSPIAEFLNAMNAASAEQNEQNAVTVEGEGHTVVFKQIAGLLARRIVFTKKIGDVVQRGERVGLIKFGSRVDVFLDASANLRIKIGDHVKGGASVLAHMSAAAISSGREQLVTAGGERKQGAP
jgi:phosphatidylserine decarboxylase